MMKLRWKVLGALVLSGALGLTASPASAAPEHGHSPQAYVCKGGEIPSGTYSRITVKGACEVAPGATITVKGNIDIRAGAMLDAQSAPSTITVHGGITSGRSAFVGLGCQAAKYTGNSAHPCASDPEEGQSRITVKGNVTLIKPSAALINGVSLRNLTVLGGGSYEIPWSIKNNTVRGSVVIAGQNTWCIGIMFNKISGDLLVADVTLDDPTTEGGENEDKTYIVRNEIGRNVVCTHITHGITGYGNTIGRRALGQCSVLAG
ncbi:MAG: hypothetical protein IPJ61_08895 [Tessaracoccus sp.]|uniref:hypothetical protein n=1 Tax=Tessaracoccus sp. TaxID=1971211 RepID=UPI001ED283D4|nr:hypothetical protein [Tessaracoccus sp.]MBK7821177.1 hypothetical protein [Tessaracoccus sp.]